MGRWAFFNYLVSSRALEDPRPEISTFIKRIDKETIGFGQGAQIGKSSYRALGAPRHTIYIFIKRIDKEMVAFGQGTQIEKSSSRGSTT